MSWPAKLKLREPKGQRPPRVETALSSDRAAGTGAARMLICTLDYDKCAPPMKLQSSPNRSNMVSLALQCGVKDVEVLTDSVPEPDDRLGLEWARCSKYNVIRKIEEIGRRMDKHDFFIFYFSGHGTQLPDEAFGDEYDGLDEAMLFLNYEGTVSQDSMMVDDEFAKLVSRSMPDGARIIIILDSCHSATMGDLDSPGWKGRDVISIASCPDDKTSKAYRLTSCLLLAVEKITRAKIQSKQHGDESVGLVFSAMLHELHHAVESFSGVGYGSEFQIRCVPWLSTGGMAWPLFPTSPENPEKQFDNPDLFWAMLMERGHLQESQAEALKTYLSQDPSADYLDTIRSCSKRTLLGCFGQGYGPNVSAPTAPNSSEVAEIAEETS